jgi:Orange carotenoid protein, N-terminal
MTANFDITVPQAIQEKSHEVVEAFNKLDTDAKLAWFYLVYTKMGASVTPVAPTAAEPQLAPMLLGDFFKFSDEEQLAVMRQIVNGEDSECSRAYGALKENNQLYVWYEWAKAMGDVAIGMPADYEPTEAINDLLAKIEALDFDGQISILRTISGQMGYSDVKPIETQSQTGKTASF